MEARFDPARDIPSLHGKVFLVTGGTAGIGLATVRELAAHEPGHVCFMGRNGDRAESIMAQLRGEHESLSISFIRCDLASLASVQRASREFLDANHGRLDVLLCNAGVMCSAAAVTVDGYQHEWQTNHLGHALLIKSLLPLLRSTASRGQDVRIINLTSQAYLTAPSVGIEFDTLKSDQKTLGNALVPGHRWARYGQAKLANMLYADALARRCPEVLTVSVHPGYIFTDLIGRVPLLVRLPVYLLALGRTLTPQQGAYTQLWAATSAREQMATGEYYEPVGVAGKRWTRAANDRALADRLWLWTEEALDGFSREGSQAS
ncbi:hypothetical protein HIM_04248 [Hirsutella minnesotensis 3608]|uniref:Oxidoreductase n=1 Tax=Hirsutella minnesotensis 3608 TaxID=1043627 RepID=A0A0F8A661_9HYPO|nr:hypothetical protein HIM_04248 [Hirsutella minnesotensis 3608]